MTEFEKVWKGMKKDHCTECNSNYSNLATYSENEKLDYELKLSNQKIKRYIDIVDNLMTENKELKIQVEESSSDFWELSTESLKLLKELQKVNYECKYWEAEAKKAVAKLGEIRILMDGEVDK